MNSENLILKQMFDVTVQLVNNQDEINIVISTDLTLKKMFDISAKSVGEQDEISNLETIRWKNIHGHICHYLVMKESSIFSAQKSTSFQILCCVLEESINIQNLTKLGRKGLDGLHLLKATGTLMESVESRLNSSGTFSQDSPRCSSVAKSKIY